MSDVPNFSLATASPAPAHLTNPPRTATVRQVSWDLLRVLAVTAVLLQHATNLGPNDHPELAGMPFRFGIQVGANSLLVISAYFMARTLSRGKSGRFVWHKLARLIPAYWLAATVTYLLRTLVAPQGWSGGLDWHDYLANLFLLQARIPDADFIDISYWTLQLQMTAFLVAAVLAACWKWSYRDLRVLCWVLVLTPLPLSWLREHSHSLDWWFGTLQLNRTHLFAVGLAIWLWSRRRISPVQFGLLLAAAGFAQEWHLGEPGGAAALAVMVGLMALAARRPVWDVPVLRSLGRPLAWLAGVSFGVYLVNYQVGSLISLGLKRIGIDSWARLALVLAALVLLGWLLTRLVEKPVYRLLTTSRRRRRDRDQSQRGSSGTLPDNAVPSPRPVNQASMAGASPRTTAAGESEPSSVHTR